MIIYGKQVCLYALSKHEELVEKVFIAKKGILPQPLYDKYKSKIKFLENKWAQSMSKGGNHQGILLEISDLKMPSIDELKEDKFILFLDGLTDAGNIGAIVRSAYVLGVEGIVATGVKRLNMASIVRTSSGAMLDMPFLVLPNALDLLNELGQIGFIRYGAAMDGESLEEMSFSKKRVLVVGSEDTGISKKIRSKLDNLVSIDMKRDFDSLNVSVATGIIIHRMNYAVK